jgi:hypothetical protein
MSRSLQVGRNISRIGNSTLKEGNKINPLNKNREVKACNMLKKLSISLSGVQSLCGDNGERQGWRFSLRVIINVTYYMQC